MVAVEFGGSDGSLVAKTGTASAVTKAAGRHNMLLLSAGSYLTVHCLQKVYIGIQLLSFLGSYSCRLYAPLLFDEILKSHHYPT